jgi:hypothetical protein
MIISTFITIESSIKIICLSKLNKGSNILFLKNDFIAISGSHFKKYWSGNYQVQYLVAGRMAPNERKLGEEYLHSPLDWMIFRFSSRPITEK